MRQLEGKEVAIIGAAGGIGSLVAARLHMAGARLLGIDRVACPQCDENLIADLADEADLSRLSAILAARKIDILVNLAGIQHFGPFDRQDPGNIRLGYVVNLIAPAILIRAVLPQMRERAAGHIVNIGSVMGAINYPHFAAYSSAKAGLRGLSEGLRREVRDFGIAVTYIAPRAVDTPFNNAAVARFFAMTGMRADEPATVADHIVRAIAARRKDVSIGLREAFLIRLNALLPRLVDAGLSGETAKARTLFSS